MTSLGPEDARLLALIAVLAPDRATALVAFVAAAGAGAPGTLEQHAERVASAPRGERLLAFATSLADAADELARAETFEALAAAERPRVAAALRSVRASHARVAPDDVRAGIVHRLLRERLSHASG